MNNLNSNTTATIPHSTKLFLRLTDVTHRVGVSGSSIWAWVKAGKFPKPIKLSENCTAWNAADVEAWAQSRIAASQAGK